MNKILKMALAVFGVFVLVIAISIFYLISKMMPGYEVANERVYYRSFNNMKWTIERREVKDADPTTLQSIRFSGGLYAKDDRHVYVEGLEISNADPNSFRVLDWRQKFGCDQTSVYWTNLHLSDDPDGFEILEAGYSKDRENVYYNRSAIEEADPMTFAVTDKVMGRAKDGNFRYNLGCRMDSQQPTETAPK